MAKVELTKEGKARLVNNATGMEELIDPGAAPAALKSGQYSIAATLADQHAPERVVETSINAPVAGAPAPPRPEDDPWNLGEMANIGLKRLADGFTTVSSLVETDEQRRLAEKYPMLSLAAEGVGMAASAVYNPLTWLKAPVMAGKLGKAALAAYNVGDKVGDALKITDGMGKATKAGKYLGQAALTGVRPTLNEEGRQWAYDKSVDFGRFMTNLTWNTAAGAVSKPASDLIAAAPRFARWAGKKVADTIADPIRRADEIRAAAAAGKRLVREMSPYEQSLMDIAEKTQQQIDAGRTKGFMEFGIEDAVGAPSTKKVGEIKNKIRQMELAGKEVKLSKAEQAKLDLNKKIVEQSNILKTHWNGQLNDFKNQQRILDQLVDQVKYQTLENTGSKGRTMANVVARGVMGGALGSLGYEAGDYLGGPTAGRIVAGVGLGAGALLANPKNTEKFFRYMMNPENAQGVKKLAAGIGKGADVLADVGGQVGRKVGALSDVDRTPSGYYTPGRYWSDRDGIQADKEAIEDRLEELKNKMELYRGTSQEADAMQEMQLNQELLRRIGAGSLDDQVHVRSVADDMRIAFDPDASVELLQQGRMTPDRVNLLRKVSPTVANQLAEHAIMLRDSLRADGKEPSGNQAAVISMLTGQPTGKGVGNPEHARVYQQIIGAAMGKKGQGGQGAAPAGRGGYVSVKNRPGVDDSTRLQGK